MVAFKSEKKDYKKVEDFLSQNLNIRNLELAERLELDFEQLCSIAKTQGIVVLNEYDIMSKKDLVKLFDFLESRLNALERKKKKELDDIKKNTSIEIKKQKDKKKPKRIPSIGDGVYGILAKAKGWLKFNSTPIGGAVKKK